MIKISFGQDSLEHILANTGLADAFNTNVKRAADYLSSIADQLPGFAARSDETSDLTAMEKAAIQIRSAFDDVLVFGTGGSSLGAQAASAIARYSGPAKTRVHFPDSLDPFEMDLLFETLNPARTHVLAISKSGGTAETLSQLLAARAWIEKAKTGTTLKDHFTFITEPGERALRTYADALGSAVIDHPNDVGGRFSVLTCVGMLPCAVMGQDVQAFRTGATAARNDALQTPRNSLPVIGAALAETLRTEKNVSQVCLMPYAESLRSFTRWFGQLWAESLGKDGLGTTPLSAVGPVDQHSQLQLYLDGPDDKLFTFITVPSLGKGPRIDPDEARKYGLDYMAGRTIGDTVTCQSRATADTLRARGKIVRDLTIDSLSEKNLGALFLNLMLETVITAHLMGIDAYDQPAVEEGKILTRQYLSEL